MPTPLPTPTGGAGGSGPSGGAGGVARRVLAKPGEWVDARVVRRDALPVGGRVDGPAIIEEPDSTTYVPPDFRAEVHPTWCLVLEQVDRGVAS